ncbi:MAG: nucleotidyl transferase AbiEii/AbiGii toxin family protein, partial [Bacteroidales bacterium]|nr:nucleotidyl transferase AbiEii/AbiGii toxin family protein [Bacteroidales bacterium]
REKFYLKGGALLYAIEQEYARPTLDMDFLGVKISNDAAHIKEIFREICALDTEDGVFFDTSKISAEVISDTKDYHGIRLSFVAHLDNIRQTMKLDIGFGDVVTPNPVNLYYPVLMDNFPEPYILAYSSETIVAEKFQAMVELSEVNSRYKDFYDVFRLLSRHFLDETVLATAIETTFRNRNTGFIPNHPLFSTQFSTDEERNKHWGRFLKKINRENLTFETVMDTIKLRLQPIYEKIATNNNPM